MDNFSFINRLAELKMQNIIVQRSVDRFCKVLKEDWYSGIGNSIQNLSQDAGEIHFSPLRNCYSLSAIKPFKPGEKAGQPAPLGGLLPKIKPHGTQQGERLMPALCPLISS